MYILYIQHKTSSKTREQQTLTALSHISSVCESQETNDQIKASKVETATCIDTSVTEADQMKPWLYQSQLVKLH